MKRWFSKLLRAIYRLIWHDTLKMDQPISVYASLSLKAHPWPWLALICLLQNIVVVLIFHFAGLL